MKTNFYRVLFLLCIQLCAYSSLFAQEKKVLFDPDKDRPNRLVVRAGLAYQTVYDFSSTLIAVERPLSHYHYVGLQGNFFHPNDADNRFFGSYTLTSGYEIGATFKYMLHGRFTGRKSGFFLGPALKIGTRNLIERFSFFPTPFPTPIDQVIINQRYTQMVFNWGKQIQYGRAVLEVALPISYETITSTSSPRIYSYSNWSLLPSISLGYAF